MTLSLDAWLAVTGAALKTLSGAAHAGRDLPLPPSSSDDAPLSDAERREAGALMRVNHVGEVCAQALYHAQSLMADTPTLRAQLVAAAQEETDHLAWTQRRLEQLGAHRSWLNPAWYAGAFAIGLVAGRAGERASLGFVVETERQVEAHLARHLERLPEGDHASRAIVAQMKADEARHGDAAEAAGAAPMPMPVQWLMRGAAKVMTSVAHRV